MANPSIVLTDFFYNTHKLQRCSIFIVLFILFISMLVLIDVCLWKWQAMEGTSHKLEGILEMSNISHYLVCVSV